MYDPDVIPVSCDSADAITRVISDTTDPAARRKMNLGVCCGVYTNTIYLLLAARDDYPRAVVVTSSPEEFRSAVEEIMFEYYDNEDDAVALYDRFIRDLTIENDNPVPFPNPDNYTGEY